MLHAQEHAAEIDVDYPAPLLLVILRSGCWLLWLNTSVVEGEVQLSERFDGSVHCRLHILQPRHVAPDRQRAASLLLDEAQRFLVTVLGYIGKYHVRTFTREGQCG